MMDQAEIALQNWYLHNLHEAQPKAPVPTSAKIIYDYIDNLVQDHDRCKLKLEQAEAINKANRRYIDREFHRWHWLEHITGIIIGVVSLGLVQLLIHWLIH